MLSQSTPSNLSEATITEQYDAIKNSSSSKIKMPKTHHERTQEFHFIMQYTF
jgi:hypothetical protein